jgi:hypothetical protein
MPSPPAAHLSPPLPCRNRQRSTRIGYARSNASIGVLFESSGMNVGPQPTWRHLDLGAWRLEVQADLRRLCSPIHGERIEGVARACPSPWPALA